MALTFLTQKEGPLPVWGWVAVGAVAFFFLFRKSSQPGSQGVQYVLSYVPQTGAGGGGSSAGSPSPVAPPVAQPIGPEPGPPVGSGPSPASLTVQQIMSYFTWANPNAIPGAMQQQQDFLNNLSPSQLADYAQQLLANPYYQQYASGASIQNVAPGLFLNPPYYSSGTPPPTLLSTPNNTALSQASTPPASLNGGH